MLEPIARSSSVNHQDDLKINNANDIDETNQVDKGNSGEINIHQPDDIAHDSLDHEALDERDKYASAEDSDVELPQHIFPDKGDLHSDDVIPLITNNRNGTNMSIELQERSKQKLPDRNADIIVHSIISTSMSLKESWKLDMENNLHKAVSVNDQIDINIILDTHGSEAHKLIATRDVNGRTSLHIAVLANSSETITMSISEPS